jgi:septal ring-binding cell division protein DamX
MKSRLFSKFITLLLAALLAGSVFAANAHKGDFQVFDPVQVNGKQLPAGEYTVTWDGDGPSVNVSITRGGKVMATATAKIVELEQKAERDATEVKANSAGARDLTAIRFSGKKYQLQLAGNSAQGADRSADSVK